LNRLTQFLDEKSNSGYSIHSIKDYGFTLNHFFRSKNNSFSEKTIVRWKRKFKGDRRQLIEITDEQIKSVTQQDVERYCTLLTNQKNAYAWNNEKKVMFKTIKGKLKTISRFFEWCVDNDITRQNLFKKKLKGMNSVEESNVLDVPSIEQISKLISIIPNIRDRAIFIVLYKTGMRANEFLNLNVDDVDFEKRQIKVRKGKRKKEGFVDFDEEVEKVLKKWIDIMDGWKPKSLERRMELERIHRLEGRPLFITYYGTRLRYMRLHFLCKKYGKIVGIPNLRPHLLRHALGTHLCEKGTNLRSIQMILRHKDISSTQIYLNLSRKQVKEDYEKNIPKLGV